MFCRVKGMVGDNRIVPRSFLGVVYNEQKAKKNEFENKQKTLQRLEEARKAKRKPKDPAADTFTERLG